MEPPPSVSAEEANKAPGSDNESKELNELKVILIGARRLPIMDTSMFNRGSSDPLVKFKCGYCKAVSTTKKKTLNPGKEILDFEYVS